MNNQKTRKFQEQILAFPRPPTPEEAQTQQQARLACIGETTTAPHPAPRLCAPAPDGVPALHR